MNEQFWKDKNVKLLGGASLIGSHLAKSLFGVARSVTVVDDFSSGKIENIPSGVRSIRFDLRDFRNTYAVLNPGDVVFHLAAQHGGRGYVAGHAVELYDNLALDTIIFRACSMKSVERVIFSSSACAYPIEIQNNPEELLFLHEDLIDYKRHLPADGPYGTEKLIAEALLDSYIERGDFKGCSTRSFTVYGPLMKENHAIAALIAKTMIQQSPFEIWGNGEQIRNWTYVTDNVQGAILAAENLDRGAINIGVEDRLTPRDAALKIWEIMNWRPQAVDFYLEKPVGPVNRVADATKLKLLGWEPEYTFQEGLERTIEWYVQTHDVKELRENFERKLTER